MICGACEAENGLGRKFCLDCGAPLARLCFSCGSANEGSAKFCGECGAALDGLEADGSGRPAAVSERRVVSVLFADLVGFTELSAARDAEEVRELLSRYFDSARRLVERYGGTVEKFIGDAVMALWGAPTANEDDAERAVRTALDLVTAVSGLADELGVPGLSLRAGVLTGEAAVTIGAAGQGMVAGDLVNTASRIQSVAGPGTVLVGETTRRASEASIAYEDAGEHELKGKTEPLRLHRALRVVAARRGEGRSLGLEPPFVGRQREFRLVTDLFHSCAEERRARLVSVLGTAGVGKSRLSWEFEKHVDGLAFDVRWHRGRCLAYGEGVAFWALAEMVRMRTRIAEDDPPELAIAKLAESLAGLVPDPAERAFLQPRLAHLLGLADQSSSDKEDLFSAWRLFFERMAIRDPVVLVLEDVQWADAALLDFVEYLLDWSRGFPIYVLTLGRPEITERRPAFGAGRRDSTSLFLEALRDDEIDELLRGLAPGLPDELRARIVERAEGVPLYAVETVRMLLDRRLLERAGDEYRPTGPVTALDVPETLQALAAARLDNLQNDERRVLEDAAVLGKTFTRSGVAALSGLPEEPLDRILQSLVRNAYRAAPGDADAAELKIQARDSLARAGDRALSLAAAGEAARYLQQAAELAEEPLERADFLDRAGRAAARVGHADDAYAAFEQAIALLTEAGDDRGAARVQARRADVLRFQGRVDEALAIMQSAYDALVVGAQDSELALVAAQLARLAYFAGTPEAAVEPVELAIEIAEALRLPEALAEALNTKGCLLYRRPHESEALLQESLKIALAHDLTAAALRAQFNLSGLALEHDRLHEAQRFLEDSVALARRRGDRTVEANTVGQLAEVLCGLGRWSDALDLLAQTPTEAQSQFGASNSLNARIPIAIARGELAEARAMSSELAHLHASSDRQDLASYLLCQSMLGRAEGKARAAVEAAEAAIGLWRRLAQFHYVAQAFVEAVEAMLEVDELAEAERLLAEAEQTPMIERRPLLEAHLARLRATLDSRKGDPTAGEGYAVAIEGFRELHMPFWLAVALFEQGEWLLEAGRAAEAEPALAEARSIFELLEARPWLERMAAQDGASVRADLLAGP